uniref:Uncharacterized protein n=1 Tax=Naja naja TaxID=35670 RepID=A0A8C6YFB0_NAJNA
MAACSSLRSVFEYETNKVVRIYSVWYGSLKWIIHFTVFLYVSIVLVADRRYQKKDSVISSVHVKVKGVSQTDKRVWDTAEYTIPGQVSPFSESQRTKLLGEAVKRRVECERCITKDSPATITVTPNFS